MFEEKSLQIIQKRQIFDGETLTRVTQLDAVRELHTDPFVVFSFFDV